MDKKADEKIVRILTSHIENLVSIYVFGSSVLENSGIPGDIDIAFYAEQKIDQTIVWKLGQEIAGVLQRDVDLVQLSLASTVMRMQVIANGVCIYSADFRKQTIFEDYIYSSYSRLNEERHEILESIRMRGSVYG